MVDSFLRMKFWWLWQEIIIIISIITIIIHAENKFKQLRKTKWYEDANLSTVSTFETIKSLRTAYFTSFLEMESLLIEWCNELFSKNLCISCFHFDKLIYRDSQDLFIDHKWRFPLSSAQQTNVWELCQVYFLPT